ncbi:MAG TPA: RIP metalloprotease RseP [Clostridiales bacterium UBA8153]|nr:RIP metalloprotease RseP [Clostridiales bacterium UBA8153]
MTVAVSIAVLGVLIFCHEAGHFWAAKKFGILVREFALGMGPRLAGLKRGETEYTLRVFPFGGFVRMAGADGEDAPPGRGFTDQPVWQRMIVIAAGSIMNFILAILLLVFIFAAIGVHLPTTELAEVMPGSPAQAAGLVAGDRIVAINRAPVREWSEVVGVVRVSPHLPLAVEVERGAARFTLEVVPRLGEEGVGVMGVRTLMRAQRLGLPVALAQGVETTVEIAVYWVRSLVLMVFRRIQPDLAGPVGIGQLIGEATRIGLGSLLYLAAVLSANLALINLLPIPALDGSRLLFLGIEGIRGRPIDPEKENFIHGLGFALLVAALALITFRDLARLVGGGG